MILFLSKKKSTYSEQKKDNKKEIHRHGVFMSDSGM